jgi:hypothetical protein
METLKQSISDDAIRAVDEFRGSQKSAS